MSEREKEKDAKEIAEQLKDVNVEELDGESLESVSGGALEKEADANGFMCNC